MKARILAAAMGVVLWGGVAAAKEQGKEAKADMRGLTMSLGGGVEGYTGALAPQINPGATWGVTAGLKPTKVLGLEFSYSGAANEIDTRHAGLGTASSGTTGADILRNGGQAVVTLGLTAAPVQPYVLGGVGASFYKVRAPAMEGFQDDWTGNIPVGVGIRTYIGDFSADLRGNYNVLFDQQFANRVTPHELGGVESVNAGSYSGMLNVGTTF